jgi:predicted RNA-binding protein associated with RNAse of E/G family
MEHGGNHWMKRKHADRPGWSRINRKSFEVKYIETNDFTGYIAILKLEEVREPLWVTYNEEKVCIVDNDYTWVQYFPSDTHYVVTKMLDSKGQPVQWYIDICLQQGIDEKGIPWFDDLYVDIVVLANRKAFVLDEDELEEALKSGDISHSEFRLALKETQKLIKQIGEGSLKLIADINPICFLKIDGG